MQTFLAFIVVILISVSLHELGHRIVARWCGAKIVRFSVGFGKPFFTQKRGDTEWCLTPIPLGGYVKMVDTYEDEVTGADLPYVFDKQHPAKRITIVTASPSTNLILAVLLYGLSFPFGVTGLRPYVGAVEPTSIAAKVGFQADDKIVSVNGIAVKDWSDAQTEMVLDLEAGPVRVAIQTASSTQVIRIVDATDTPETGKVAKNQGSIGLLLFRITNRIGKVPADSPAGKTGLKENDKLLTANGKPIESWQVWVELFRTSPGRRIELAYERGGKVLATAIRPDSVEQSVGVLVGGTGLIAQADKERGKAIRCRYTPSVARAFELSWNKTVNYSWMTLKSLERLVTDNASLSHIFGPLAIADIAGQSAKLGLQSYLEFLTLVSVSLGVLNLLPVPTLDGGHLVFYTAEWIHGKPLSGRIRAVGLRFGLATILLIMAVAFFDDINHLFG